MAQFVVYENPNRANRKLFPFLLDIQSDLLEELRSTVVIPLCPVNLTGSAAITKLCPMVEIDAQKFLVMTQQIAGVDRKLLGKKAGDLSKYRREIIAALDFVIAVI